MNLSSFTTENVTSMNFMFNSCTSLTELDLSKFNTKNCKTFNSIFTGVKKVKVTLNIENNELLCGNNKDKLEVTNK